MRTAATGTKICILLIIFIYMGTTSALAGGGQHYANGVTDFLSGALPPAGTYLENHLILASKNRLVDNSGDKIPVDLSADAVVNAARFIHVTPYTLFGASWGMHTIIPIYTADVEAGPFDFDDRGIGDITFSPLVLGWHFSPQFHTVFALDFIAPTGNYDSDDPSTQLFSRNHWTIEPALALTWMGEKADASIKLMYDLHSKNNDYGPAGSELEPGDEFHFEYGLGCAPAAGWHVGVVGYNHWQLSDDKIDGLKVQDQRSRIGAAGPGIKYWPGKGPFSVTLKHYWEYGGRNIAVGQNTQLKIQYRF